MDDIPPDAFSGLDGFEFDHVAQAMSYEDMLSWLLFYYALFDVEKTAQIELADPVGVVLSQAVQTPDGALRVTMNGSAARDTLTARAVSNYFGAGVQHSAIKCDDIFEVAAMLEANGAAILDIPGNYYDDLRARFELSQEDVERLRIANILYDRSDRGEYWQIYTRAFAKRFFFEFVQRKDYQGYGATNAPVRIAAQARHGMAVGV